MSIEQVSHFFVLMLENRSFDHMLGFLPKVDGLKGTEVNFRDGALDPIEVSAGALDPLTIDPGHDFDDHTEYDHSSIVATVLNRFGESSLTERDHLAKRFDDVFTLDEPRTDAPWTLEVPGIISTPPRLPAVPRNALLGRLQNAFLDVVKRAHIQVSQTTDWPALEDQWALIRTTGDAEAYIHEAAARIRERTEAPLSR